MLSVRQISNVPQTTMCGRSREGMRFIILPHLPAPAALTAIPVTPPSWKVNPRTPEEGDKVTITPDPDSGYGVDEVIVTDRNGREIDVTANRDGTYTFEQPRGRVTIEVTFTRTGESAFFTDVPETFWAYDEIAWAYDNGYVNGTTATTFSPNADCTRAEIVTFLYRAYQGK